MRSNKDLLDLSVNPEGNVKLQTLGNRFILSFKNYFGTCILLKGDV